MQLHPAVAIFAALAGVTISGVLGAFMALPAAAVIQATVSTYLTHHEVLESELTRGAKPGRSDEAGKRRMGVAERLHSRFRRERTPS
jgi:hypothetical protein